MRLEDVPCLYPIEGDFTRAAAENQLRALGKPIVEEIRKLPLTVMDLTDAQRKAFTFLAKVGKWMTAPEIGATTPTLKALENKEFIESRGEDGRNTKYWKARTDDPSKVVIEEAKDGS